jgi:hypothetical protein
MRSFETWTDAQLLASTAQDPAAFGAWYRRRERDVLSFFRYATRSHRPPRAGAQPSARPGGESCPGGAGAPGAGGRSANGTVAALLAELPSEVRAAVEGRVVDERG